MTNIQHPKSKGKKGFTLLELLIVIAIIGILVTLGVAAYTSAQKQARDGRRRGDLKSIQNAFEQYYADNSGSYPSSCSAISSDTAYFPGGFPKDPKSGTSYDATPDSDIFSSCSSSSYYFGVKLETSTGNATGTTCTNGSGSYFCVKNLQ